MRMISLASAVSAVSVVSVASVAGWAGTGLAGAAPPTCADLDGVVDANQTCQIQATNPGYSLHIGFPVDYPDAQSVFDYVQQTRDGFLNVAQMPDLRLMPYELDTTSTEYSSTVAPRKTQSVVFKTYQGVGGAHPTTFYQAFNWDLDQRKPITIDTLFKPGSKPFPVILPLVQAEVNKQLGQPVTIEPGDGLDPSKYQNFALTNDSLVFFFSQGDVLPEAAGALQVTIPRGPVAAMIA